MNKIKDIVIEKLKNAAPSNRELNIFVVISRYQDDHGFINGAYYKDVCTAAACSYPTFYSAIRSLEKKKIVKLIQNKGDWDILILENDFSKGEAAFKEGYLNMNHDVFFSKDFFQMTAIEKLMIMDLMRKSQKNSRNGGKYHIGLDNFYSQYSEVFKDYGKKGNLSKRVLQNCMKKLKKFFNIGIFEKKYWISPKNIIYKKQQVENERTENSNLTEHIGKVICRREKLDYTQKSLKDVVNLLNIFKERFQEREINPINTLFRAVKRSLEIINKNIHNKNNWKRTLVPSLVNKVISQEILGYCF